MLIGTRASHDPAGYGLLEKVYPGDDLLEHFRFIRANVRRDRPAVAAELRVAAGRLVLTSAKIDPESRAASVGATEELEGLAARVERGDFVKQAELDQTFAAVRMAVVSVRWATLLVRWHAARSLSPAECGKVIAGAAEELEQAVWLLGSELGRAIDPALKAARAVIAAAQESDSGTGGRLRTELAVAEGALVLLRVPGAGERGRRVGEPPRRERAGLPQGTQGG